jgi:hypothetical protein
MAKAMFLVLHANNHGKFVSAKIQDGCVIIDNKQFFVDQSNPILIEKAISMKPLYIIKWSAVQPATNMNPQGKVPEADKGVVQHLSPSPIKPDKMVPSFKDKYDVTPDMFRKIMGMKILGNMIKTKKSMNLGPILLIVLMVVAGIGAYFGLHMMHVI